ncbi:choice-of-anchor Q domain-containing protein [Conexibacter sp. SYSU D00693]|uniref:choice-of-anchor Q domain-containing protein n=1 Tax=Conexibacter sp. SYSU D00693 TaxID=2812560 RepID=UPI00196B12D5|nr:choice-of-anchor Q domain-containing protein [Conexibacter sp. SYSU D00693]
MKGRKVRAGLLALISASACAVAAAPASAATIPVACNGATGDPAALNAAVTTANGTPAADTIQIAGPCTFTYTTPAAPAAGGNNTALPVITQPLTLEGNGATIVRSNASGVAPMRMVLVFGGSFTLRGTILGGGALGGASQNGAGIASLNADVTIDRSQVVSNATLGGSGNTGGAGGAIATAGGTLTVTESTLYFNLAQQGGAISVSATPTTIRRSTVYGNIAANTGGLLVQGTTATVENSTFGVNQGNNGIGGIGAAGNGAATTVNVASSTFADNGTTNQTAPGAALLAINGAFPATINVTDTIVTDTDSTAPATLAQCSRLGTGAINDQGGNLEWPHASCGFGTRADPQLGALGGNGGLTATYKPKPGSPAIDLGGATCPSVDQRGFTRPDGDGCDAGSVETEAPQTSASGPTQPVQVPSIAFMSDDVAANFECSIDNGPFNPCTSPLVPQGLESGEHTVRVRARTTTGYEDRSPAVVTFTVDVTPPTVQITSAPSGTTTDATPTIEFSVDGDPVAIACQVDDGPNQPCTSPFTTQPLGDGSHTVTVRAADAVGNVGGDSATFTVDANAPVVDITSAPSSPTNDNTPTVTFTVDDAGAAVTCRVDDGPAQPCATPFTTGPLPDGLHTITVTATDASEQSGSDSATFVVDTTAPETTITGGPSGLTYTGTNQTLQFTFTSNDPTAVFECRLDGGTFAACSSPKGYTNLANGSHTFQVRARDAAGNVDATPASRTFTVQRCTIIRTGVNLLGIPITICL